MIGALLGWLYANVWGNLIASAIAFVTAYLWKIRPHLKRQAIHRARIERHLDALHTKHDDLAQQVARRYP